MRRILTSSILATLLLLPSVAQDVTVYITRTGAKYHNTGCQYLRKSKIAIKLKEAKKRGYTKCSRC